MEARLAVVETHVEYMRAALDEIRSTQLEIRDQQLADRSAAAATKKIVVRIASVTGSAFGLVGSAIGWFASHGKLPLLVAGGIYLSIYAQPAQAQRAPQAGEPPVRAWVIKIKACPEKGLCKMRQEIVPSQSACEISERSIREALPLYPPGLSVTLECLVERGETSST